MGFYKLLDWSIEKQQLLQGVHFTTVFFQSNTAPTKLVRLQKFIHWRVSNELTFMWVSFVAK